MLVAGRNAGDGAAGLGGDLLENILDEEGRGAGKGAYGLAVVDVFAGVAVVVHLAAGADPDGLADERALVFWRVGALLFEEDHVVLVELGGGVRVLGHGAFFMVGPVDQTDAHTDGDDQAKRCGNRHLGSSLHSKPSSFRGARYDQRIP